MGLHSLQAMRGEYEPHAESTAICSRIWLAMLKLPWRLEATCCCQQHPSGEDFPRFLDIPRTLISNRSICLFVCLLTASILLFWNLFPVSLFTAAVYQHQANQMERAIADTIHLPPQSQKNGTLWASWDYLTPSCFPLPSLCSCALRL